MATPAKFLFDMDFAAKGEIMITKNRGDEELVF